MLSARDDNGEPLTEEELLDNLRLFVFAGHETTAASIAWMMINLAHRPALWDRLCEEANALDGVPETPEQLAQCPFAEALFREAVRLYPPVFVTSRRSRDVIELEGHHVPANTMVLVPLISICRDAEHFEHPERYMPERWLGRPRKRTSAVESCQFGGGAHFCLGFHLALLEGVQFAVAAARGLTETGKRLALTRDRIPTPVWIPLMHPPRRTITRLVPTR